MRLKKMSQCKHGPTKEALFSFWKSNLFWLNLKMCPFFFFFLTSKKFRICVIVSLLSMFMALDLIKKEEAGLRQEMYMSLLVKGISCCSASNGLSAAAIPCCSIIHGWCPDESQHDGMVALDTCEWKRKRSHASRVSCLRCGSVSNLRSPEALHACLPSCNEILLPAGPGLQASDSDLRHLVVIISGRRSVRVVTALRTTSSFY